MFKSVFTKYIFLISLLIVFSFLLQVLTVSAMISDYSFESKTKLISRTADSIEMSIETYHHYNNGNSFPQILVDDISGIAEISDSLAYVVDLNGNILMTNDNVYSAGQKLFSESIMTTLLTTPDNYSISRMDNTFEEMRFNVFRILKDSFGKPEGILLISSTSVHDKTLSGPMIRTLFVVSLWILIASCITVYILFQRITVPLKNVSEAAKAFAKGDFKQRVKVIGDDEVADLAQAFNNMAEVLEKNDELRNSFLGSVSHDLRTPMTVIQGYVDGIRDGTIPAEKQNYYLEIISSEVRRLSRLVNTLLEISRMESGEKKLNFTKFNVSEKARQILLSFEKRIDEKHVDVEFNCEKDITVNADTDAIHRVIFNLMDNAVKFVNENGTLTVTIEQIEKKARITIRNTGDGIPPEELPRLFDRFYKSDRSRGLDKTGTGLGLYIAKTTINMHNEDMTVKSVQGEYTEFSFTLSI